MAFLAAARAGGATTVSIAYRSVGWNRQKRRYDTTVLSAVAVMLLALAGGGALVNPNATIETLLIRAFAISAFILLHVVLSIGPLCRLDRRFLPLLYNRRHLGVTMFTLALAHGLFAIVQFHGFGDRNPLVSLLTTSADWTSVSGFPFQIPGLVALLILFLMAATSHDFWLHNLTAPVWKTLHMGVYVSYTLIITHVAFGALQSERSPWLAAAVGIGAAWVVGLHIAAGLREMPRDRLRSGAGLVDVGAVDEIPDTRAVVACVGDERVAVFRYGSCVSAISNVCRHQNGPLGEGKVVNGCVVCPWHGYEYLPHTGASPPPFTEKVATFTVYLRNGRVLVDPRPHPPGTRVEPARIE
jgi:nitrite reductase/ring-hydroxylating ferredoxin subunit/DMSO/TMAO reductase YedYZ heme-binding membrane subunit